MGLTSSLHIGRTALNASSLALQVTGNNLANAADPRYARRITEQAPLSGVRSGRSLVGRGVSVTGISRQIDDAIQARLYRATADASAASTRSNLLGAVESIVNELSDNDLSSELSRFFNSWSDLASSPDIEGSRRLVVEQGRSLASSIRTLRSDLVSLQRQIDGQIDAHVTDINQKLETLAEINSAIVTSEAGSAIANALRDQRDDVLSELSESLEITPIEQQNGSVDLLIGSTPIVLNNESRGLRVRPPSETDGQTLRIELLDESQQLEISGGSLGALLEQRDSLATNVVGDLDRLAGRLAYEVNRIHSVGDANPLLTSTTSTLQVRAEDLDRPLNDPDNLSFAQLPIPVENGSISIEVINEATGASETHTINISLLGSDNDTTLRDLIAEIDDIDGLSATLSADGTFQIEASGRNGFRFDRDNSGVLAVLGVNAYFTGTDATSIDVDPTLASDPTRLAIAGPSAGGFADNGTALSIATLQDLELDTFGGMTVSDSWLSTVQDVGTDTAGAFRRAESTAVVRDSLEAQRAAVSGVSVDEESVNLITYQRQYQSAAQYISTVNQLTDQLLSIL